MAIYKLAIPSFHIGQVRSAHTDTLFASTSLKVMNANGSLHRDWGANGVSLGDRKAGGGVDLNLSWENVDVPDPTPENPDGGAIYWTFLLANKGHGNSDFLAALNKLADAYAGALAGKSLDAGAAAGAGAGILYFLGTVALVAAEAVITLLAADCDGMVASGAFNLTAAQLANETSLSGPPWSATQNNPGTDSNGGCGENSNYDVNYQISRVESQHVDLYAADANGAVVNAGQWMAGDVWQAGYIVTSGHFTTAGAPVTAVTRTPDVTDLYVVRPDGSVWNAGWWSASTNNAQWNAGYAIPGAEPGFARAGTRVSAVARIPDVTDLYVVRSDGSVWNAGWWAASANSGKWNAGYAIPGAGPGFARADTTVAAIARNSDTADLYVVRSDGSIWNAGWWSASANNGKWNAGYAIPGAGPGFAPAGAALTVVARTPGVIDLYVVRSDGSVWNAGWWSASTNNAQWNAGYAIPGAGPGFAPAGAPLTAVARTADTTDLYVVRPDGSVWNAGWWSASTNNAQWNAGYAIPNAGPGFTKPGSRIAVTSRH